MPLLRGERARSSPNPKPNTYGSSRRHIIRACEDSLRRLGTDWIDLYQVHRPDYATDVDETLGALSDLIHQGKVRAIGSSTFPADLIVEAQWTAERRGRERFRCEQPPYSIFVRSIERDLLPVCQRYGMGAIVWSPLNGGWLSGKYRRDVRGRHVHDRPGPPHARAVRPERAGQRRASSTWSTSSRSWPSEAGHDAAPPRPGLDAGAPGGDLDDHRAAHHGAPRRACSAPTSTALSADLLDRIDELVPPGTNISADRGPVPAALAGQRLPAPPPLGLSRRTAVSAP